MIVLDGVLVAQAVSGLINFGKTINLRPFSNSSYGLDFSCSYSLNPGKNLIFIF